jgi:geranylgeranyl diphosphate synthase type II
VIAGAEICGGKAQQVMPTACAMELIHTYSLIHDDLPAMDDDDLRRGRPTNHIVFGEDIAILAGDALLTEAFDLIAKNGKIRGLHPQAVLDVLSLVSQKAGTLGMIGGQVVDIRSDKGRWKKSSQRFEGQSSAELLRTIHLKKTAALIVASLEAGARLVGAPPLKISALKKYGTCLGLAFQVKDDILDKIGDKKKLGKKGSDAANQKLTYPALHGLQKSISILNELVTQTHASLRPFGQKAAVLHQLADFVSERDH